MDEKLLKLKNTIVVNLFGGQGTGKSTTMADLFAYLKHHKIDCEMCSEFAKELVWENRKDTFKDELYIFSKQNHRLFRCNGKVDVVITDRPLLMSTVYNEVYGDKNNTSWNMAYDDIVVNTFKQYNNFNVLLKRVKEFNPNGRNETEEQAKSFDIMFKKMLVNHHQDFIEVDADENARNIVGDEIIKLLQKMSK